MARRHTQAEARSPEQLEHEIRETRHEIEETLDQLGDRLSPGELLDQGLAYLRESGAVEGGKLFFTNLGRSVRDNPLAVALTASGVAWLMASGNGHERHEPWPADLEHRLGSESGEGSLAGRASSAAHRASDAAQRLTDAAHGAGDRARETGQQLRRTQHELRARAQRQTARARDAWTRMLDEQPLLLGLAGMALGALIGGGLPGTEREDELMGEARDDLVASAAAQGRAVARDVGATAREAGEQARETVEEARREPESHGDLR